VEEKLTHEEPPPEERLPDELPPPVEPGTVMTRDRLRVPASVLVAAAGLFLVFPILVASDALDQPWLMLLLVIPFGIVGLAARLFLRARRAPYERAGSA
jgi:hypothetical protein